MKFAIARRRTGAWQTNPTPAQIRKNSGRAFLLSSWLCSPGRPRDVWLRDRKGRKAEGKRIDLQAGAIYPVLALTFRVGLIESRVEASAFGRAGAYYSNHRCKAARTSDWRPRGTTCRSSVDDALAAQMSFGGRTLESLHKTRSSARHGPCLIDACRNAAQGSSPGLISATLADAEEHLRAKSRAIPTNKKQRSWPRHRTYGTPQEFRGVQINETAIAGPFPKPSRNGAAHGSSALSRRARLRALITCFCRCDGCLLFAWAVTGLGLTAGFPFHHRIPFAPLHRLVRDLVMGRADVEGSSRANAATPARKTGADSESGHDRLCPGEFALSSLLYLLLMHRSHLFPSFRRRHRLALCPHLCGSSRASSAAIPRQDQRPALARTLLSHRAGVAFAILVGGALVFVVLSGQGAGGSTPLARSCWYGCKSLPPPHSALP